MSEALKTDYHHGDLRKALIDRAAEVIKLKGIEALSLRSLARDLGVSHGAPNRHFENKAHLLTALASDAYAQLREATLKSAEKVIDDPWVKLNAMGQGFVHWALENPARFNAIMHPDLSFYESEELKQATEDFNQTIKQAVIAAQSDGRHPGVDINILMLFTVSVPMGAALLMSQSDKQQRQENINNIVTNLIELVVPVKNRSH